MLGLMLFGFSFASGFACSRPECERNSDCGAGRLCTLAGVCEDRPFRPPGEVEDAGPVTPRDVSVRDTGELPEDGGDAGPDIGEADAGAPDGGPDQDAGPPDFGPLDGGVVQNEGLIWVGEHSGLVAPAGHVLVGRFIDELSSGVVTYRTVHTNGPVTCEVVRKVSPAVVTGFAATRLRVSGFENGFYDSVDLNPTGPGTFGSGLTLGAGMFFGSPDVLSFSIVSSGANGSLDNHQVSVPPPHGFAPGVFSPQVGTIVLAQAPINVSWSPAPLQPNLRTVLELSDANGAVRLTCEAADGLGQISVPESGRSAFLGAGPVAPVQLELRYQSEISGMAPLVGQATGVPSRFRASIGVRWSVQL